MPPEAKDVPVLMAGLVRWVHKAEKEQIPVPIIAALVIINL
jgi:Fic family protein